MNYTRILFFISFCFAKFSHCFFIDEPMRNVCTTPGCARAAKYLKERINENVNPCDNFYDFACGKWVENTKILDYQFQTSTYDEMQVQTDLKIKDLIEKPYDPKNEGDYIKAMKTYYNSCMDTDKIEKEDNEVLKSYLTEALGKDFENFNLYDNVLSLANNGLLISFLVNVNAGVDLKNTSRNVLSAKPNLGGQLRFNLYKKGFESRFVVKEYESMVKIAEIFGFDTELAKSIAKSAQQIRINLANTEMSTEAYKKMSVGEFDKLFTSLNFRKLASEVFKQDIKPTDDIIVRSPEFVEAVNNVFNTEDKKTLAFLLLHSVVVKFGAQSASNIRDALFQVKKEITSAEKEMPRWRVCVIEVNKDFDIGLSSYFIQNNYVSGRKSEIQKIHSYTNSAMMQMLRNSKWLDEQTKKEALRKVRNIKTQFGYPEEYLVTALVNLYYDGLVVDEIQSYLEQKLSIAKFRYAKKFAQLNQANIENDWKFFGNALEVKSDYLPTQNAIRMTEAYFYEPLFSSGTPDFMNFAYIGWSMGHETNQAFDMVSKHLDDNGNDANWWNPEAEVEYNKRAQCLIDQFSSFSINGMKVNGSRTFSENFVDNEGIKMAYSAYRNYIEVNQEDQYLPGLSYSPDQLFWIASATMYCTKTRDEYLKYYMQTNVQAPRPFRVNGPMMNSEAFAKSFECPLNSAMNPASKCSLW